MACNTDSVFSNENLSESISYHFCESVLRNPTAFLEDPVVCSVMLTVSHAEPRKISPAPGHRLARSIHRGSERQV